MALKLGISKAIYNCHFINKLTQFEKIGLLGKVFITLGKINPLPILKIDPVFSPFMIGECILPTFKQMNLN